MCTAVSFKNGDHYFGRNLDLEYSYNESVVIMPRNYPLPFRCTSTLNKHYALIGVATIAQGFPLYYDATNEHGLSIAGLNFPEYAHYNPPCECKKIIAPFEFIPWILGQCKCVTDVLPLLQDVQIAAIPYSKQYGLTPLHWIVSDKDRSIVLEPIADGLRIYENPFGILTNSPSFDFDMQNIRQYLNLTCKEPSSRFSKAVSLTPFSRGAGAFGLPGDNSSASRFIRAAFTKFNSVCDENENSRVSQFFHILRSVEQVRGSVEINGQYEITLYSSCCNTTQGIYYYTTYENSQINAVSLHNEDLDSSCLTEYPLIHTPQINFQNM